ncbi:hypothetical protein [Bradyrhizobium sp. WD16]|uniref:hypothetical protein n=1 Tax=Bradyrhizobium sp. WD16 TaxID=1521768 RepID=UPI0020A58CDE|nr:hypothetical protein [Bradyrhizobium sp. WD16]
MRKTMLLTMLAAVGALLGPAVALAAPSCPPGQVQKCDRPPLTRPPQCRCVSQRGPWVAPGGKAEIHKKNVPTVKPNKGPGTND